MRIGILGAGPVGQTLATKLRELGHDVAIGTRTPRDGAVAYSDAARDAELLINATGGTASLEVLACAGAANLAGKVLIDISNPLDFSKGMPPSMLTPSTDSLGEQIQRAFPKTLVVKSLNTVTAKVMVEPAALASANHDIFMAGNDAAAKGRVKELLQSFGWRHIVDVGDITGARGLEMYLPLWVRLYGTFQTATFNVKIIR